MNMQDIQVGAVLRHTPTGGRYCVQSIGKMRTPPLGEWVQAARYTSLDRPSDPEYYRPLGDFGTFELLHPAGVAPSDPVPSLESAVKLPLHQAAQWNMAVACAALEPHKPVSLEGRTVLAVHEALTRGVAMPRVADADLTAIEQQLAQRRDGAPFFPADANWLANAAALLAAEVRASRGVTVPDGKSFPRQGPSK
jgi:hypothetical protein